MEYELKEMCQMVFLFNQITKSKKSQNKLFQDCFIFHGYTRSAQL